MKIHSCPKTVLPCCRGMGVSSQKRESRYQGLSVRPWVRRAESLPGMAMKILPWNGLMRVSARLGCTFLHRLCPVPLVFEKRPPCPCPGDAKQRERGKQERHDLRMRELICNFSRESLITSLAFSFLTIYALKKEWISSSLPIPLIGMIAARTLS